MVQLMIINHINTRMTNFNKAQLLLTEESRHWIEMQDKYKQWEVNPIPMQHILLKTSADQLPQNNCDHYIQTDFFMLLYILFIHTRMMQA
jgi:hypothetical protein